MNSATAPTAAGRPLPSAFGVSSVLSTPTTNTVTITNDGSDTATISVTLRDVSGAALAGITPTLTATGTGNTIGAFGASNANGITSATFKSTGASAHVLTITAAGRALVTTLTVTASGAARTADATKTTVALSLSSLSVAGTATITVQAKDSSSVNLIASGGAVTLTAGSPGAGQADFSIGAVTDNNDGTYTATLTATVAGTVRAISAATINGASITTTLPSVTVVGTPWLEKNYNSYLSSAAYRANTVDFDNGGADSNKNQQSIDTDVSSLPAELAAVTQLVKYDYVAALGTEFTIGRQVALPSAVYEAWYEVWVKFSSNFTTAPGSPPDFKGFHTELTPDGYGRFQANVGGVGGGVHFNAMWPDSPAGGGSTGAQNYGDPTLIWTGNWSRLRWHCKVGTFGGNDTINSQQWCDASGNIIASHVFTQNTSQNATHPARPQMRALKLFSTIDPGVIVGTMSIWIARIRAYNTDPGWGI